MTRMTAALAGLALLLLVAVGGVFAWRHGPWSSPADDGTADAVLPVPPVPPRIASGPDYERCLDMIASDPSGAANFADAWYATGGGDGAAHCLALADIALGNTEDGAAMLEKLAAGSHAPGPVRAVLYGEADQARIMLGNGDQAFADATLALSLSPDDPDLLINRAVAAATIGRFQDAVDDLDRALAQDPRRGDALVYRAAAWRHLGQLDKSRDDIDRALTLDPDDPEALLERGILRERDGDLAGARSDWERASTLSPDSATADLAQQNLALLDAGPVTR